jgi:hypothetical protein
LGRFLDEQAEPAVSLPFGEIETMIGKKLCKSAYRYASYWYPSQDRPVANIIYNAGFDVACVDLKNQRIQLCKEIGGQAV